MRFGREASSRPYLSSESQAVYSFIFVNDTPLGAYACRSIA